MAHISARAVIAHTSNLPRDVSVNTFHFESVAFTPEMIEDLSDAVIAFYNTTVAGGHAVCEYISNRLSRTNNSRIEVYNMADVEPRVPVFTKTWTLGAAANTVSLPAEVAVCASYHGSAVSGVPQARRRGRIFIGPLTNGAMSGGANEVARPNSALITTLVNASHDLCAEAVDLGAHWAVYSRVLGTTTPIVGGWVDNDFDTQRRRSAEATDRTLWTLVEP